MARRDILAEARAFTLFEGEPVRSQWTPIDPQTASLYVEADRVGRLAALDWPEHVMLDAKLIIRADDQEWSAMAQWGSTFIDDGRGGNLAIANLSYTPPFQVFSDVEHTRLGERRQRVEACVELTARGGDATTTIRKLIADAKPAPRRDILHRSVSFQNTASAGSASAGLIDVTITVTAGSNLALFVGSGYRQSGATITVTHDVGGTDQGCSEGWTVSEGFSNSAGHYLLSPTTGSSLTTRSDHTTVNYIMAGVIVLEGVSGVGTASTANGSGTSANTGAVTSDTDEIVCGSIMTRADSGVTSADTEAWIEEPGIESSGGAYKTGAASTSMSWSWSGTEDYACGALPFQAAAAASEKSVINALLHQHYRRFV